MGPDEVGGDLFEHIEPYAARRARLEAEEQAAREAQEAARRLLEADPELRHPDHRPVLEKVRQLFADTPDIFN